MDRTVWDRGKYAHYTHVSRFWDRSLPYIAWYGSPDVPMEPLEMRNMQQGLYYSTKKQKGWALKEELQEYLREPLEDGIRIVCDRHPLYEKNTVLCKIHDPEENGALKLNEKNAKDLVGIYESHNDPVVHNKTPIMPRKRRQHRDHHRPHHKPQLTETSEKIMRPHSCVIFVEPLRIKRELHYKWYNYFDKFGAYELKSAAKKERRRIRNLRDFHKIGDHYLDEEELASGVDDIKLSENYEDTQLEFDGSTRKCIHVSLQDLPGEMNDNPVSETHSGEQHSELDFDPTDWLIISEDDIVEPTTE